MKALPLAFVATELVQVEPAQATHLRIWLPGPVGLLTLPVQIKGTRAGTGNWTWNGDVEKPTLRPSVLTQSGHFAPQFDPENHSCWCKFNAEHPGEAPAFHCYRCHCWVTDGKAQFIDDTTHEFRGKTVELLHPPTLFWDRLVPPFETRNS